MEGSTFWFAQKATFVTAGINSPSLTYTYIIEDAKVLNTVDDSEFDLVFAEDVQDSNKLTDTIYTVGEY